MPPIAIVGPLPPTRNGIADYSHELLPYLTAYFQVYAVIADDAPTPTNYVDNVEIIRATEALADTRLQSARFIYHVGNNPDHSYMLPLLFKRPGIIVLHDFILSYLLETSTFPYGDRQTYTAWAQHDYGDLGRRLAADFIDRGWRGSFMSRVLALNGPVLSQATSVITHSRYSQFKVAARIPLTPVHFIPHHVSPAVIAARNVDRLQSRKSLGLPENAVLVHAFGFITPSKLINKVMESLSRMAGQLPDFRLVIAGEKKPQEYDIDKDIGTSSIKDFVITTDYITEEQFQLHLTATDLVINLRWPSGGESSGSLTRALGRGRACIIIDSGPMGEFPDACVAKVRMTDAFEADLDETLMRLINNSSDRDLLESNALALASDWTPESSAQRYAQVVTSTPAHTIRPPPITYGIGGRAAAYTARTLNNEIQAIRNTAGMWWRVGAVPVWSGRSDERIICKGATQADIKMLQNLCAWPTTAIDHAEAAENQRDYAAALIRTPEDTNIVEAAQMLSKLASRLRRGATVVIECAELPNGEQKRYCNPRDWLHLMGCGSTIAFSDDDILPEFETDSDLNGAKLFVAAGRLSSSVTVAPRGTSALTSRGLSGHRAPIEWSLEPARNGDAN